MQPARTDAPTITAAIMHKCGDLGPGIGRDKPITAGRRRSRAHKGQPGTSHALSNLRVIWKTPDRPTAEAAIATFADKYVAKHVKAVTFLVKDRDALLAFYDASASTETTSARPTRLKALSQDTARLRVFMLVTATAKT